MPYGEKNEIKVSNVDYLARDFNETSPGMMLLELSAYVGDVLGFYVDQQYREMLLPLAEERKNLINLDGTPILNVFVFVSPDIAFIFLVNVYLLGNPVVSSIDVTSGFILFELLIVKSTTSKVSKIIDISVEEATFIPLLIVIA